MTAPATPKPRRKWRRRLLWLLGLVVALRLLLPLALPWLADLAVKGMGLSVSWQSLSLSFCGGSLELRGLRVMSRTAPAEATPLLQVAHVGLDVEMTSLLSLPTLQLAVVEGVHLQVARNADGSLQLPAELTATAPPATAEPAPDAAAPSLRLPVLLREVRLADLHLVLDDATLPAPGRLELVADAVITDLGDPTGEGRARLRLTSPQLLSQLRVDAVARSSETALSATVHGDLRGLRLQPIAAWLESLGVEVLAREQGGSFAIELEARTLPEQPHALSASLQASAAWHTDGAEVLALPKLQVACDRFDASGVHGLRAGLSGLQAGAEQRPDGSLHVLGFALHPQPTLAATPPLPAAASAPLAYDGVQLQLRDCQLRWQGLAGDQPLDLQLQLEQFDLGPLASSGSTPAALSARLHLPQLARDVVLHDGAVSLTPEQVGCKVQLAIDGLTLHGLRPMLLGAGVACDLQDGKLSAGFEARADLTDASAPVLQLELRAVQLEDRDQRVTLPLLAVHDVRIAAATHQLRIGSVAIEGPRLVLDKQADGSLQLLSLRYAPPPTGPTAPATAPLPAPGPAWQIELPELRWRDAEVQFTDHGTQPATRLSLQRVGLSVDQLVIGRAARGGTMEFTASIPGVIEQLTLGGQVTGTDQGLGGTLQLRGDDASLQAIAAYLAAAGLQPTGQTGSVRSRLGFTIGLDGSLGASIDELQVREGDREVVQLAHAELRQFGQDEQGMRIGGIDVQGAMLAVQRGADGLLQLPWLRQLPPAPAAPAVPAQVAAPTPSAAPAPAPARLTLDQLRLQGVELRWTDAMLQPPLTLRASLDASSDHLAIGKGAGKAPLRLRLSMPDGQQEFTVTGTLQLDPAQLDVDLQCVGTGLDGSQLTNYLPPGQSLTLRDGRLAARLQAQVQDLGDGVQRLACSLRDFSLHDGDTELLAVPELRAEVARLDLANSDIDVDAVVLQGGRALVRRSADGLRAAGVLLHHAPPGAAPSAAAEAAAAEALPGVPTSRQPRLRLGTLDLQVAQLTLVEDVEGADAAPLHVALRLHTDAPWQSKQDDPMLSPPLLLQLDGSVLPLCRELHVDASVDALAAEPHIDGKLRCAGLDTRALLQAFPALQQRLAAGMTDGVLSARFEAELDMRRRRALQFDFARPFALTASVRDLQLRESADGPLLAGIESIELDAPRIDPQSGSMLVRSLEVSTPALRVQKDKDGLDVCGVRLLPLPPPPAPVAPPVPATGTPASVPSAPPAGDLTIDLLAISGLDVVFTDRTTDPVTVLPLNGLDFDLAHFSTRALRQPDTIRFSAYLRGGEVDLPERQLSSSLLAGILGSATKLVTGGGELKREQRPLLDEVSLTGAVQLFPAPTGLVKLGVSGFELQGLAGMAKQGAVEIGDGLLDAAITLDLQGKAGADVDANIVFTHLSLSEPPGGPISTYLKLPAPLDSVLYLLRNDADEQRIPLAFHFGDDGISSAALATESIKALGVVLAKAIASSPLRLAGAVGGALGIGGLLGLGGSPEDLGKQVQVLTFDPSGAALPTDLQEQLQPLLDLAGDDTIELVLQHVLGGGDIARAALLANPEPEVAAALAMRLRQERAQLQGQRARAAEHAAGLWAAGDATAATAASEELRSLDHRLGLIELGLRPLLTLLRPDAGRGADRRTREACFRIAEARLQTLRDWLVRQLGPEAAARIELRRPRFEPVGDEGGSIVLTPKHRAGS